MDHDSPVMVRTGDVHSSFAMYIRELLTQCTLVVQGATECQGMVDVYVFGDVYVEGMPTHCLMPAGSRWDVTCASYCQELLTTCVSFLYTTSKYAAVRSFNEDVLQGGDMNPQTTAPTGAVQHPTATHRDPGTTSKLRRGWV